MRRVFPLKPSDNCPLPVFENAEERHAKDRKLADQASVDVMARPTRKNYEADCQASGDENLPAADNREKESAALKSASLRKPPRASAYPVFTAGTSLRHAGSAREKQAATKIPRSSVDNKGPSKDACLNKNACQQGRPRSTPKNRPLCDVSAHASGLRASSMRLHRLPDSVTFTDLEDGNPFYADSYGKLVTPSRHSYSGSQAASERSCNESSDSSSCFTKSTESSSCRSVNSESPSSKSSSVSARPGYGSSPFRYLNARMVAEKLVKVLGKEKTRVHQNGSKNLSLTNQGADDAMIQESEVSSCDRKSLVHPHDLFPSGGKSLSLHSSSERWCLSEHASRPRISKVKDLGREHDDDCVQSLELRALAREELASTLERGDGSEEFLNSSHSNLETPYKSDNRTLDALRCEIRLLREEKRVLASEVAAEIRARIYEQKTAADQLRRVKDETYCQVTAVEKDKVSIQESLERELERRGEEWTAKLEKMRMEERRMRDKVTEMTDDRVDMQKMIASFKVKEASWKAQSKEYDYSLCTWKQRAMTSEAELTQLKQSSTGTLSKLKVLECELDALSKKNNCLEVENLEFQKELTRLRRVCNGQETTLEGLWQELDEAVNGTSESRSESMLRLQRELLRLAGVEQALRNEVDALHSELTGLKQQADLSKDGSLVDVVKFNQELQVRMEALQGQVADLQEENRQLSIKLRTSLREGKDAERALKILQFSNDWNDSLKNSLKSSESSGDDAIVDDGLVGSLDGESLFLKLLRGKLQSRETELEQLDEKLTDLTKNRDSLQIEADDLHGKLVMANQRIRELERQIVKKNEEIETLRIDLQKQGKELKELQDEVPGLKRQRDEVRKEADEMSREALRLTFELTELKKVAEKLEEEVMLKEGQISILRGAYSSGDYFS